MVSIKIIEKAIENFDHFQNMNSDCFLLNKLQNNLKRKKPFSGVDVLFIQHHLEHFIGRLNSMIASGLELQRAWFIDIPYSTHSDVVDELQKLGFSKHQMCNEFNHPLIDYCRAQEDRVSKLISALEQRTDPKPLLVIDDGAYFARFLNTLLVNSPNRLCHYAGTSLVEQTTRGHRYLCNEALEVIARCNISVVTIAKCKTKKLFEGPFIGAAISRALIKSVGNNKIHSASNIVVIGYGVVGAATVRELHRVFPDAKIDVVDTNSATQKDISLISKHTRGLSHLPDKIEYDIVFGCTGYNSFHIDQRTLLADDAILASGSSAAIEFNRTGFIELADAIDDDEIEILDRQKTIDQGIHADIHLSQEGGKKFKFLNAGFPVNFNGKHECLPEKFIQGTHGLLFMASLQALMQKNAGINTINPADDEYIYMESLNDLQATMSRKI